jgi:hypothetical protein
LVFGLGTVGGMIVITMALGSAIALQVEDRSH